MMKGGNPRCVIPTAGGGVLYAGHHRIHSTLRNPAVGSTSFTFKPAVAPKPPADLELSLKYLFEYQQT